MARLINYEKLLLDISILSRYHKPKHVPDLVYDFSAAREPIDSTGRRAYRNYNLAGN